MFLYLCLFLKKAQADGLRLGVLVIGSFLKEGLVRLLHQECINLTPKRADNASGIKKPTSNNYNLPTQKIQKLKNLLSEAASYLEKHDVVNEKVSAAPVGWHLEHSLLTLDAIIDGIKKSEPASYKSKLSFARLLVMTLGKIPRGRAKAPERVRPASIDREILEKHFEKTDGKINELTTINSGQYFLHPYFGNLRLKPAIRFMEIHTRHHLDIVRDILKP